MLTEADETSNPFGYYPDLFAEPHDHANMWDISAFWDDQESFEDESPEPPVNE